MKPYLTTVLHIHLTILSSYLNLLFLKYLLDKFGTGEFLPNDKLVDIMADIFCSLDKELEDDCRDVLFLICGFDVTNINTVSPSVKYSIIGQCYCSAVTNTTIHYSQHVYTYFVCSVCTCSLSF